VVSGKHGPHPLSDLAASEPSSHRDLMAAAPRLDEAAGCAQDIEFTIQSGQLWLLQTRAAEVQSARSESHGGVEVVSGRPVSTGVGSGIVVWDSGEAEDRALAGEDIILARTATSLDDVHAMAVVRAVLTEIDGATSHVAVVSREVACVVGCGIDTVTQLEGLRVTVDATNGKVHRME
jgi:pyruvate,orthophosphate dikinase